MGFNYHAYRLALWFPGNISTRHGAVAAPNIEDMFQLRFELTTVFTQQCHVQLHL